MIVGIVLIGVFVWFKWGDDIVSHHASYVEKRERSSVIVHFKDGTTREYHRNNGYYTEKEGVFGTCQHYYVITPSCERIPVEVVKFVETKLN